MLQLINRLLGKGYQPLNQIYISKEKIIQNYHYLLSINNEVKIVPVLKSNAYGHGIINVGRIVDSLDVPFICVDSLYEAYELLKAKIKTPILIMGYIHPESLKVKKLPFSYAVYDLELVKVINQYQKGAEIHVFVDTGMHREGVQLPQLEDFLTEVGKYDDVEVAGLMTHLAEADNPQSPQTKKQLQEFEKAYSLCKKMGIAPKWFHVGGSGAIVNKLKSPINIVRCGIAMYGIGSAADIDNEVIQPALTLTTKIVQIKNIKKGDKVGYNFTFTASKAMTIGILPIGYYDGIDRRISNKGVVTVDGIECPIIGMVSMNLTTVDLSALPDPQVGQKVVVISDNSHDPNSVVQFAKRCQTIPYDILVHLASSTRRNLT